MGDRFAVLTIRGEQEGDPPAGSGIRLHVLGRFDLVVGRRAVAVGTSGQRLLTLLAINNGRLDRGRAAGLLWPQVPPARANGNLRSVLWRLQRSYPEVLDATFHDLRLASGVLVDVACTGEFARRLLDPSVAMDSAELKQALQYNFHDDIAPDLDDEEWLQLDRERHRRLRLRALESLAEQLLAAGCYGAAIEAAFGAVRADPFRESARQLLIRTYLAEGNQLEARRQYSAYSDLLRSELDLEPSEDFLQLLGGHNVRSVPQGAA